jgi:hypothetical protein
MHPILKGCTRLDFWILCCAQSEGEKEGVMLRCDGGQCSSVHPAFIRAICDGVLSIENWLLNIFLIN